MKNIMNTKSIRNIKKSKGKAISEKRTEKPLRGGRN